MGLGNCTGWPFHDLDPRSWLWHPLAKMCLSAWLSENHASDHYKTWQHCCPSHGDYLIRFWRNSVENCYFCKFSLKISDVFFQGQTLFWPYLRNGWSDWCETKRKCIGWILGTICDLDLWPPSWPWPWMFKVKFRNSSICRIVGLIDVKWKGSELIWYWANCMTLPFDHTMTLTLEFQGQSLK